MTSPTLSRRRALALLLGALAAGRLPAQNAAVDYAGDVEFLLTERAGAMEGLTLTRGLRA